MKGIKRQSATFSVVGQVHLSDIPLLANLGFRSLICNRPDGEGPDQPSFDEIASAAKSMGMDSRYIPVTPGSVSDEQVELFSQAMHDLPAPVLGYCRSGARAASLWSQSEANRTKATNDGATNASHQLTTNNSPSTSVRPERSNYAVVIVGAGAAGVAVAASLLKRQPALEVALIDPAKIHYYQPGWSLVGAGVVKPEHTQRTMASVLPNAVQWIQAPVTAIEPESNCVCLDDGRRIGYQRLIVCPGVKLDWDKIEGLSETLGQHGVSSNYRYDLAPYTWSQLQSLTAGQAIFTHPPMPIKCAGAPQEALFLAGDHWQRRGVLKDIEIAFNTAEGVLIGVDEYVPALYQYINRYQASLNFYHNLVAIDGPAKKAWFDLGVPRQRSRRIEVDFDFIHVCPPQCAPDFISGSSLADSHGWVDVDHYTLRHNTYDNIWSLGDVSSTPNSKTAAAARKQAPVVAANVVADMKGDAAAAVYDGYGSCPLTVERGKVVLPEYGYGGRLMPSFPGWLITGQKPSRAAGLFKEKLFPSIYWNAMLRGREFMAKPKSSADMSV